MTNDLKRPLLSDLHPRAERLIYDSGDASLINELLNEALTSFLKPSCNANHGAGASTETQSRMPFYRAAIVFSYVNMAHLDDIREFPHVIEHEDCNPDCNPERLK